MNALLSLSAFYVVFLSNEHESYQPLSNKVAAVSFLNVNGLLSQCILGLIMGFLNARNKQICFVECTSNRLSSIEFVTWSSL